LQVIEKVGIVASTSNGGEVEGFLRRYHGDGWSSSGRPNRLSSPDRRSWPDYSSMPRNGPDQLSAGARANIERAPLED